jgi:hypothetical protein
VVEQERRNRLYIYLVSVPNEVKSWVFSRNNASAFDLLRMERVDTPARLPSNKPELLVKLVEERSL